MSGFLELTMPIRFKYRYKEQDFEVIQPADGVIGYLNHNGKKWYARLGDYTYSDEELVKIGGYLHILNEMPDAKWLAEVDGEGFLSYTREQLRNLKLFWPDDEMLTTLYWEAHKNGKTKHIE